MYVSGKILRDFAKRLIKYHRLLIVLEEPLKASLKKRSRDGGNIKIIIFL